MPESLSLPRIVAHTHDRAYGHQTLPLQWLRQTFHLCFQPASTSQSALGYLRATAAQRKGDAVYGRTKGESTFRR